MPDLFEPVVPPQRLNETFRLVAETPSHFPARTAMQRAFDDFQDADPHFREQLQTTGFDARVFELFMSAFLRASEFEVRNIGRPDFLLRKNGLELAVEATTANPTQGPQPEIDLESEEGRLWLSEQYLPVKFGSPLYSKLQQRYWDDAAVVGKPLVFAVQAFAFEGALEFASNALAYYLYGLRPVWHHDQAGRLHVHFEEVGPFRAGEIERPGNFFGLPDAENVSAVIFANSGTVPKFGRMAYQEGVGRSELMMRRLGVRYVHDPDAAEPAPFEYEVGNRIETWGEGLEVFHNPNARHPLSDDVFPDAAQTRREGDELPAVLPPFHPFSSVTLITPRPRPPREEG